MVLVMDLSDQKQAEPGHESITGLPVTPDVYHWLTMEGWTTLWTAPNGGKALTVVPMVPE